MKGIENQPEETGSECQGPEAGPGVGSRVGSGKCGNTYRMGASGLTAAVEASGGTLQTLGHHWVN